jgi:hypothetical protein
MASETIRVYLPWLGEFGTELIRWVPGIYGDPGEKIVCHEAGKASIYPSAGRRIVIPRIREKDRKSAGSINQFEIWDRLKAQFGNDKNYVHPKSTGGQGRRKLFVPNGKRFDFETDVVLFPRKRTNGARRNWDGWEPLAEALKAEGLRVFAAGHGDSSFHLNCHAAWDYCSRYHLDASIWAIKHSKLRIGMITSLSVLSLYCGRRPWVLTTADGRLCEKCREKPNINFLKWSDHLKVGWDVFNVLGDIPEIVKKVKEELN